MEFLRRFICVVLVLSCNAMYPVLLKNGASVPYDTVQTVYKKLEKLDPYQLHWLQQTSYSKDLTLPLDLCVTRDIEQQQKQIKILHDLGLCDSTGKLDHHVALVVSVSVGHWLANAPNYSFVRNPIAIKSYFMPAYWSEKIKKK